MSRHMASVLLVLALAGCASAGTTEPATAITILHTNDLHGDLAALCRAATVIDRVRRETAPVLVLDAGDFTNENRSMAHVRAGQPMMLRLMGRIGYDAATPGNHDMEGAVLKSFLAGSSVPLLYGNPTAEALGRGRARSVPFIVRDVGGVKVGIVGLTINGAPALERAKQVVPQVRQKADVVIALTHLGLGEDIKLAQAVPGIDLIVGGHTHVTLSQPRLAGGVPIVCTGGHGEFIGRVDLTLDQDRRVTGVQGRLISLWSADVEPDPTLWRSVAALSAYVSGKRVRLGEVIGRAEADFSGRRDDLENAAGSLVADALRRRFNTDLALLRGNVLSPQIPKGPVTVADAHHVIRWDAPAVTLLLTGNLLRQVLEHSLHEEYFHLRMSGVRIWYDPTRPAGQRLVRAEVNGRPLDPEADYRIATEEWLANGRNLYEWFLKANRVNRTTTDIRDIFIEHVRAAGTIAPPALDRTVDVTRVKVAA